MTIKTGFERSATVFALAVCAAFAVFAGTAANAASASDAGNTAAPQIQRRVLEQRDIPGTDEEMQMILVEFPPGAASRLHHHTAAGLVYVLDGTAESAYGDEPPKTYHAGDTMQDLPIVPHTVFRNPDQAHALRFLIFTRLRKGEPYLVIP